MLKEDKGGHGLDRVLRCFTLEETLNANEGLPRSSTTYGALFHIRFEKDGVGELTTQVFDVRSDGFARAAPETKE